MSAEYEGVTVVLVTKEHPSEEVSQRVAQAMLSVEEQVPEADLVIIVQDTGSDISLGDLRRYGAQRTDTKWVTFIAPGEEWAPDRLQKSLDSAGIIPGMAGLERGDSLLWLRDFYLASVKRSGVA